MRFLFITKEYPPIPDPSGRIVYILAEQLKSQGHVVDVIARDVTPHITEGESGNIYWLKISFWEKLSKTINSGKCSAWDKLLYRVLTYIRKFVMLLKIKNFPNVEKPITNATVKLFVKKLILEKYDMVIGFFRPYSCLEASMKISQKMPTAKIVACYFDLVEDKNCPTLMPISLYRKLIAKGDRVVFENCDNVMLPMSAQKRPKPLYGEYSDKIVYYDFPTFSASRCSSGYSVCSIRQDKDTIKFVFAGTLSTEYRNPISMLDIINNMAKQNDSQKFHLDIFGGGDCHELIDLYNTQKNFSITHHGKVSKEIVTEYEEQADVLINIMNSFQSLVPSKIFELFSTCKPILNITTSLDDGSMEYFERYPLVYTTNATNSVEDNAQEAFKFISSNIGKKADFEDVERIYASCTPRHVAEQILNMCRK